MTSMTDAWREIVLFNDEYFPGWRGTTEISLSNALAGEVGEVCNMTKHRAGGGTKDVHPSVCDLMDELADCFVYLALLVEQNGGDLSTLAGWVSKKMTVNRARMEARHGRH